jgi:formylglycine-generating enzyme required for sulfatase activity
MAQEFIQVLNKKSGASYRLPSEAEWEYAARERGRKVKFGNGKDIADPAEMNFNASKKNKQPNSVAGAYREKTNPVNLYKPNALGLYDMSGNVWEWCADYFAAEYYQQCQQQGTVSNPQGPETDTDRVLRGGSWHEGARGCRTTFRYYDTPALRNNNIGFRLVLSALPVSWEVPPGRL